MRTTVLLLLLYLGAGFLTAQTTAMKIETLSANPAITCAQTVASCLISLGVR